MYLPLFCEYECMYTSTMFMCNDFDSQKRELQTGWELPCVYWQMDWDPQQDQQVVLTMKSWLQA